MLDKPPATPSFLLERHVSARRDIRVYLLLCLGIVFLWAGISVEPAGNCSADGRECAPWLVHVARWIGAVAALGGIVQLWTNPRWGSRVDSERRCIEWWDQRLQPETRRLSLDDVARIRIVPQSEGSDVIFLYDAGGALLPFPQSEVMPGEATDWAREIAAHFPHIAVEVAGS